MKPEVFVGPEKVMYVSISQMKLVPVQGSHGERGKGARAQPPHPL